MHDGVEVNRTVNKDNCNVGALIIRIGFWGYFTIIVIITIIIIVIIIGTPKTLF